MSKVNKDYLYYGLAYEYLAIAELYYYGYEAQKITADFGYDILATNLKRVMDSGEGPIMRYFQIKARKVREKNINGLNGLSCYIEFKEEEINDFIKQDGREKYLRVYINSQENMSLRSFWLSHIHIQNLLQMSIIKRNSNGYKFTFFLMQNNNNFYDLYFVMEYAHVLLIKVNDNRLFDLRYINDYRNNSLDINFFTCTLLIKEHEHYQQLGYEFN